MPERVRVSVVYSTPDRAFRHDLDLPAGATAGDAIERSAIVSEAGIPDENLRHIGIFGRPVDRQTILRDGDRVEIYRPLKIDPKEARRRRASGGRR